jgi:hypothetical protein
MEVKFIYTPGSLLAFLKKNWFEIVVSLIANFSLPITVASFMGWVYAIFFRPSEDFGILFDVALYSGLVAFFSSLVVTFFWTRRFLRWTAILYNMVKREIVSWFKTTALYAAINKRIERIKNISAMSWALFFSFGFKFSVLYLLAEKTWPSLFHTSLFQTLPFQLLALAAALLIIFGPIMLAICLIDACVNDKGFEKRKANNFKWYEINK